MAHLCIWTIHKLFSSKGYSCKAQNVSSLGDFTYYHAMYKVLQARLLSFANACQFCQWPRIKRGNFTDMAVDQSQTFSCGQKDYLYSSLTTSNKTLSSFFKDVTFHFSSVTDLSSKHFNVLQCSKVGFPSANSSVEIQSGSNFQDSEARGQKTVQKISDVLYHGL